MPLTEELISQFVKATKDDKQESKEETVYGTIVEYNDSKYLKIDGSELLTPISSTTNVKDKERVTAMIKNHTVTVTGNLSNPSASTGDVESVSGKISEFENIVAGTVTTEQLEAESARIDDIIAGRIVVSGALSAESAEIKELQADNVTIKKTLTAQSATIEDLKTNSLTAESADLKYANIDFANIGSAAMEYFYAQSGLIKDVTVGDQTITGNLVGVTISGDLIEGNTVVAEKLVIKGSDGLYYKLNTDGMAVEAQQTDYNSINGSVIKAKSITATKISVKDLVAFGATIGGFHITDTSIYSGTKESVGNTTRGIYLDKDGQIAFGDTSNYLKFFKDTDGSYKLAISADSMRLSSGKDIDSAISDLENRKPTYVQFVQPTGTLNVGDIWVKAVNNTIWNTLSGKNWTEVKNSKWGEIAYCDEPSTYVWNGSKWVLTVDYNIVKENSTSITQTKETIELLAEQERALSGRVVVNETKIEQNARDITIKATEQDPATYVKTSTVTVKPEGIDIASTGSINVEAGGKVAIKSGADLSIQSGGSVNVESGGQVVVKSGAGMSIQSGGNIEVASGGTLTVAAQNFTLDAQGNMEAKSATLEKATVSGDIFVNGSPALSQKNIYVGTNAPTDPKTGMVWIKPDSSTSAQTTFTKQISWGSHVHMVNTPKTGSLTGTATVAVGTVYTYRIKVPVYLSPHTGTPTGAVLHFELATTSGGTAAVSATKNVTITDYGSGNKVVEMEVTGSSWIGNQSTLYFSLYTTALSGYYAYNVLNSSDTGASITVDCISTSSSGASGWCNCTVFWYA